MTRLLGALFVMFAMVLANAGAQPPAKNGKLDVDGIFKKLDTNNDGKLQKDEFLKLCDNFKNKDKAREKLTAAFDMIDSAKIGYLTTHQYRTYLESGKKKEPNP